MFSKRTTAEMDNNEFLVYLKRKLLIQRLLTAGAGIITSAAMSHILSMPSHLTLTTFAIGGSSSAAGLWLFFFMPKFVPSVALEEIRPNDWMIGHPLLDGEMTEQERQRRIHMMRHEADIM